jgi:hypothetical protein
VAACLAVLGWSATSGQEVPDVRDGGVLRLFQAGTEVGRETFARTPEYLHTETIIPLLGVRLSYRTEYHPTGPWSRFVARIYRLPGDSLVREYEARADGSAIRWVQRGPEGDSTVGVGEGPADAVVASQSLAVFMDLVRHAGRRDTVLRFWSPERLATLDLPIVFRGDTAELTAGGIPFTALLAPDGRVAALEVAVQRIVVERATSPELPELPGLVRPRLDYSAPPEAAFTAREVRVPVTPRSGAPFELAGTLTLPKSGAPPYPAVVTITGSGGQDRDENLWPLLKTYRPFRDIAVRLAREGIAVLRMDDRGVGASGGARDSATMEDFAEDVRAQVAWLRAQPEIDGARIALLGHSEGGVVGPMVAATDRGIAAVVVLAGTAKPGAQVLHDQLTRPIETAPGLSPERRSALRDSALAGLIRDSASFGPWMRHFWAYDPRTAARQVRQPVLILHGELDRQVTVGQADTLAAAIRAGGNGDVTVRVFPRLNHLFLVAPGDGAPHEYPSIRETTLPTEVTDAIASWLRTRLRSR